MTFKQIEKSFFEHFARYGVSIDEDEDMFKFESPEPSVIISFLKQSFIKYLQEQVKEAENKIRFIGGETYCVFCKQHRAAGECNCDGWNEAKIDQITHITNQIKGLEV